tara:strand:+ start:4433 stop:4951 length:519 start_codon:yes stop_codon:yes gene_type:complete
VELDIRVSTTIQSHEDPELVVRAVKNIFPDWVPNGDTSRRVFPHDGNAEILYGVTSSMDVFLEAIAKQNIMDTALDAMSLDMEDGRYADFSISRQAALVGKVSFPLGERVTGGEIDISISGNGIDLWLEEATWHRGRSLIPRNVGDDLSMSKDGTPNEWFDKKGKPTIGDEP